MNARSVRYRCGLVIQGLAALLLGFLYTAGAQSGMTGKPNPQTGLLPDPALPSGMTYASTRSMAKYSLFGSNCCIHPKNVTQGALGDCFFMSSMDALAMVSPSTIANAIHYNPASDTYTIRFFLSPGENSGYTAHTYTTTDQVPVESVANVLWNSQPPYFHPIDGINALTNPQPYYAHDPENVLWPLLLEKGFAALHPDGYRALAEGGYSKDALQALTGKPSTMWVIPESDGPLMVTVKNMPAMADVGGHSILGGLLTGKGLTAVEPQIQVCISARGQSSCTAVCKPGHDCTAEFLNSGKVDLADQTVTVEVFDVPSTSERNKVAEFEKQPGKCIDGGVCQIQPLKSPNVVTSDPVSINFHAAVPATMKWSNPDGTTSIVQSLTSLSAIANTLKELTDPYGVPIKPVTAGTILPCAESAPGYRCVGDSSAYFNVGPTTGGLIPGHEYYLMLYRPDADPNKATVTVGNPWGARPDTPVAPVISLSLFQKLFFEITSNDALRDTTNCSCKN